MKTYAIRGARTKLTGHYRQPGTRTTFCNRPIGIPNGDFLNLSGWKLCTRCVKAEQRDRAAAAATADAWLDQPPTSQLAAAALLFGAQVEAVDNTRTPVAIEQAEPIEQAAALTEWERDLLAADIDPTPRYTTADENAAADVEDEARQAAEMVTEAEPIEPFAATPEFAAEFPHIAEHLAADRAAHRAAADIEARYAAELITEAEATAGTWRGEWIGQAAADGALFTLTPDREQGALFA
jgi:hypothetical protein